MVRVGLPRRSVAVISLIAPRRPTLARAASKQFYERPRRARFDNFVLLIWVLCKRKMKKRKMRSDRRPSTRIDLRLRKPPTGRPEALRDEGFAAVRNPYSRSWLWIPGSRFRAPRNDGERVAGSQAKRKKRYLQPDRYERRPDCQRDVVTGRAGFDRSAVQRNQCNPRPPLSLFAGT